MKAYLFALEIHPVKEEVVYKGLPLHCTLIHWFWVESILAVTEIIDKALKAHEPPLLHIGEQKQFTGMTNNGPIPVLVNSAEKNFRNYGFARNCCKNP